MRVCFQSRRDLFDIRGGDTVIIEKLAHELGLRGVEVVVDAQAEGPDLRDFDLVHLFNLGHRDCYAHGRHAHRQSKPIAITTIYWPQDELVRPGSIEHSDYVEPRRYRWRRRRWALLERLGLVSEADARRRRARAEYLALGARGMANALVEWADVLLPSAPREHEMLLRCFPAAATTSTVVVPYGIDPQLFDERVPDAENAFLREHGVRDFLLCVGRVEPRKNQARLLEAVRGLGLPVVLLGLANDAAYAERVRALLGPRDLWVESWPHGAMGEIYSLARLHVLPSLLEIPGLVSLEAAALGVPVVIDDRGSASDYLGDRAEACDPTDPADIRRACEAALARPYPDDDLAAWVPKQFNWARTADGVLEVYRRLLG